MRSPRDVEAEIMDEYVAYLASDLADDKTEADKHEAAMNRLLEEYGRIPHPRLPSDQPVKPQGVPK